MSLDEMIDQLLSGKDWHSIRIFNIKASGGDGYLVSLGRDQATFVVDTLVADAPPSAKLRQVLSDNLRLRVHIEPKPVAPVRQLDFDDILG